MMGKAEVGAVVKQARGRLLMDSTRVMSSPRILFLAKSGFNSSVFFHRRDRR